MMDKINTDLFKEKCFIVTQRDIDEAKERLEKNNGKIETTMNIDYNGKPVRIKFLPINSLDFNKRVIVHNFIISEK